ncbi:MAG TPA: DNA replication and repair protein RecF [Methylomirabilota bacterium]|nr:DNA replication and repair protein RecF [Methylomirabilota bacterium]
MQIGCVQLLEFRNYRTLSYRPEPRLNLLTGRNAQGKTNFLEGLAVLLTGRSFRTTRLAELPRWGAETAVLSGELLRSEGVRTVRRTIQRQDGGAWQASGEGCPWARVIVFGWQDLAILHGAPAARRAFIDGFAARLYTSHLPALLRYRRLVEQRNRLLQSRAASDRLAPWDEQVAAVGMELIDRRRRAVAALQTELARVYPALAAGPAGSGERQKVQVGYRSVIGEATEPAALVAALERARPLELRRGQTLVGPHRDDLAIEIDGVEVRPFSSRGQQRLLALALRIAEVLPVTEAAGTAPVLLLDDALSELDPGVRDNVLREIRTAEQVFLTSPEPLRLSGAAGWVVEEGGIAAA